MTAEAPSNKLIIGSRESALAVAQARHVMALLAEAWPDLIPDETLMLQTFKTQGDIILDRKLSEIGDKGLFVKELEEALLSGKIDVAVHSLKDMPGDLPDGLVLHSAGEREDPRDVFISNRFTKFSELPPGAIVGTSSLRRVAQLSALRPDLAYKNIRGNLQTRLRKLDDGEYDAIILAAAGVHRLGMQERITHTFEIGEHHIPAVGQGILGVEFRGNDAATAERLEKIRLPDVETAMQAERAVLRTLQGGCQIPMGAHATPLGTKDEFRLDGILLSTDGTNGHHASEIFTAARAEVTGISVGKQLLAEK